MDKFIKKIKSSSTGKKFYNLGMKIINSKTGKQIKNSTIIKNLNKKLSKFSYKQKIGGVILVLVMGNLLFGGEGGSGGTKWDEPKWKEMLPDACIVGKAGNAMSSDSDWGYTYYLFEGYVKLNAMTKGDWKRAEKWFDKNCYGGW